MLTIATKKELWGEEVCQVKNNCFGSGSKINFKSNLYYKYYLFISKPD